MSRLIFTFFFVLLSGTISPSVFAGDADLEKATKTLSAFHTFVSQKAKVKAELPSVASWKAEQKSDDPFGTDVLVSKRPQVFAADDLTTLLTMAKYSNEVTKFYMNGGAEVVSSSKSETFQERHQDEVASSVSFSIHAMTNVAQSFVSYLESLPEAERNTKARKAGKAQINDGMLNLVLAVTAMSVGDHISEANRLKMVDALAINLPGMSTIISDITLAQIGKNLSIRLLQHKSGSPLETRLVALEKTVAAMQADESRKEILSN